MYLEHFGFREYPFSLTPDTEYFYDSSCHSDVLNVLQVALRCGDGFIAVTAEVGLGKTLLCRLLLRELDNEFTTAYIPDPLLSPRALRIALADELKIDPEQGWTDDQLLRKIQRHLIAASEAGRSVVLLLDEAHQLSPQTLEAVRLLTNLETEKFKLLQVVMFGQPELDRRLAHPSMRQLRQRIGFHCTLTPLDRNATATYIQHRLEIAASGARQNFCKSAIDEIYKASGGTPRLINMLCHKALMAAFGCGDYVIELQHVKRAIADSSHAVHIPVSNRTRVARWFARPFAANRSAL